MAKMKGSAKAAIKRKGGKKTVSKQVVSKLKFRQLVALRSKGLNLTGCRECGYIFDEGYSGLDFYIKQPSSFNCNGNRASECASPVSKVEVVHTQKEFRKLMGIKTKER